MPSIKDIEKAISAELLNCITEIDRFSTSWKTDIQVLSPDSLKKIKRVATIESIGSSNRIEGNKMSDEEIEKLFQHINIKSFVSRDEEEVAGYADLLNTIFENYESIPLTENYIKQLHQILLRHSQKDERHRGEYKKDSNRVAAFDADGKEIGTVFNTATPFDTPRLMEELVDWTNKTFQEKYLHPIIIIGIFLVHFLSIHPFTDGNGRLSRAITLLLMLKNDYAYMPYCSMESLIEANKEAYYRALHNTQKTFTEDTVDYQPWLNFFVRTLKEQKRMLESKIATLNEKPEEILSPAYRAILSLFDNGETLTISEITERIQRNANTVRKAVYILVKKKYLIKAGTTKDACYSKKL